MLIIKFASNPQTTCNLLHLCRFGDVEIKGKRSKPSSNKARERQRDSRERRRAEESRVRRYPVEDELLQEQLVQEAQAKGAAPSLHCCNAVGR